MNIVMVEEFNLRIKISSNFTPQFYALSFHSNDFPLSHNFIGKYYLRVNTRLDTKKKKKANIIRLILVSRSSTNLQS